MGLERQEASAQVTKEEPARYQSVVSGHLHSEKYTHNCSSSPPQVGWERCTHINNFSKRRVTNRKETLLGA
jgi:hypothetical protein